MEKAVLTSFQDHIKTATKLQSNHPSEPPEL